MGEIYPVLLGSGKRVSYKRAGKPTIGNMAWDADQTT